MMSSNRSSAHHLRNIARTMWRFRTEGFLCDTVLYADDGQEVRAHSIVLAAASPVFRDALRADGSDSSQRTEPHMIQLPGCDLATLEMALHVIYTGSVEDSESMGATTEDLQRVFLLLQQLGVDLDRIEGCSITYVESEEACTGGLKNLNRGVKTEDAQSAELDDDSELNETVESQDVKAEEEDGGEVSSQEVDDGVGHIDGTVDNSNEAVAAIISGEEGVVVGSEDPNAIYEILSKVDPNERYYVIVGGDAEDEPAAGGEEEGYVEERVTASEGESDVRKVHCPHCGMGFPKVSYLHVHMRKHTGEKPFECDRCGRGFSQRANLQRHVQGHVGEKPYLCFLCGKSFIQKIQLTSHLTQAHSGDDGLNSAGNIKRFKCRICEQVFAERGHLRQHAVKMHPELHREAVGAVSPLDKTHVCDTCGRGYTTMGALRMHMRVHTGELLACNLCDKAYVNRALLEQHLRTHTREKAYECKHCGKAFIYKNALTVHIRTHTGEKPYVCPICHNSYSQFGHLQSHKKTHTGERPYSCTICSKSYRQRVDLRMHLKRVHQDMPPPPSMRHAPVENIKIEEVIIESAD